MASLNEAFWRWFGNSKVRNADGSPMVVHHGAPRAFKSFSASPTTVGFFFTDSLKAARARASKKGKQAGVVVSAYLMSARPLDLKNGWPSQVSNEFDEEYGEWLSSLLPEECFLALDRKFGGQSVEYVLKNLGYDGIVAVEEMHGEYITTYVVFEPTQIKSINNDGTWDRDDPNITSNPIELVYYRGKYWWWHGLRDHLGRMALEDLFGDGGTTAEKMHGDPRIVKGEERERQLEAIEYFRKLRSNPGEEEPQLGTCYRWAVMNADQFKNATVVHGTIEAGLPPRRFGHAWVESEGRVYDEHEAKFVHSKGYSQEDFERIFKPIVQARYSVEDALLSALGSGHTGPWSEDEVIRETEEMKEKRLTRQARRGRKRRRNPATREFEGILFNQDSIDTQLGSFRIATQYDDKKEEWVTKLFWEGEQMGNPWTTPYEHRAEENHSLGVIGAKEELGLRYEIPEGTVLFHGSPEPQASKIEREGTLRSRPGAKMGGGMMDEGDLIWFHKDPRVARAFAEGIEAHFTPHSSGSVFAYTTTRPIRVISRGSMLRGEEAKLLNRVLAIPSYKHLGPGDSLAIAIIRASASSKLPFEAYETPSGIMTVVYPIALEALGFDAVDQEGGIGIVARELPVRLTSHNPVECGL